MRFALGAFVILHGLVHLLYVGQAVRILDLRTGMTWPDGSWAFSKALGDIATRRVAGIACALAATSLVAGGVATLTAQSWWREAVVGSAAFSGVAFVLFWNGKAQSLSNNGLFAVLINLAIVLALAAFGWPRLGF